MKHRILRGIISGVLAASMLAGTAFSENSVQTSDTAASEESASDDAYVLPKAENMIFLQNDMRGVFITPETDFKSDGSDADVAMGEISGFGMNAAIINSVSESEKFYDLDLSSQNGLNKAIDAAHEAGLSAYITLDANALLEDVIENGGGIKEGFSAAAHKFAMKYGCEGIILTDFYTSDNADMYAEYLRSGSGIGYKNWLYEINQCLLRTVSEAVHGTNNITAVGILIEDMWANSSTNKEGSDTSDTFQSLYDGFCDTKKYIEQKYADFVMVKAYGSTENTTLNFKNVVTWWKELCAENDVKTYVCHLNERIGNRAGWNEDQLLRQLTVMKDMGGLGGSAFNSFASLKENPLNSTDSLLKYFNDQINTDTLFEDLEMISPTQLNFVTYDTTVKFAGTFDENFDVYFNGSKITLNEVGNFYIPKDLNVGKNTFVIEHKGKKYTYNIERRVDVMKSIEPTSDLNVEGGTSITLKAVCYKGSKVSASVNGKIVALTEKTVSDTLDPNGSYSEFIGTYTTPDGIIGKEQALGHISFYANFMGMEEYMTGGSVTVEAKPEPPKTDFNPEIIDQSTVGTGEVVGTIDPIVSDTETIEYIKVLNNYSLTFDPNMTGNAPSPVFSEMPAGTLDYYKSTVGNYLVSTSGKRYRMSDVKTFTDTGLGINALKVNSAGNMSGKSFIKMSLDYKVSFNVTTDAALFSGIAGPFYVKNFNAHHIYITFDNITSVTKMPDLSSCALFSSGEWEIVTENGVPKFRLVLTLRQAGIYSGVAAYYDSNNELTFAFNVPTPSLAGKVIVIDPGHGYTGASVFDVGAVGEVTEQSINCAVSKKLESVLTQMGATVYRLPTETTTYVTVERQFKGREYDADMFISLHCNSTDENPKAHGVEAYYFTPFSQPLAAAITNNLSAFFDSAYADGTVSSRGEKYDYFWVTTEQSFPSVLVEMGFVSNPTECLMMVNEDNQTKMAEAIANGVKEYFMRSSLSN